MNIEQDPTNGFKKLNFLLNNPPFPPETFPNLILLYCKYEHYDLAADVLAENADLTWKCLPAEDYEFLETPNPSPPPSKSTTTPSTIISQFS
jgi:tetratricopeptide repeat protein 30